MSQYAVPIACQIPFKSGFPSAVRGPLSAPVVCPEDGPALNQNADTITITKLVIVTPLVDSCAQTSLRFVIIGTVDAGRGEIGRALVCAPVSRSYRMPSPA